MLLNHNPNNTWLAIMTEYAAYFDDSGHPDDQQAVVVAGFISSEAEWLLFEREWKEILDREGIDVFHMVDFESSKIWPQYKKDAVLRRLVNTIRIRTIRPIAHAVLMADYKRVNETYALEECLGTPYAIAGRTVAKSLNEWKKENMQGDDKLLVFFEDGTKHKGDFIDAMERDQQRCPAFLDKTEAVPLQAADWFAWEIFNAIKRKTVRSSLESVVKIRGEEDPKLGIYGEVDLEAICRSINLPERSNLSVDAHIAHHSSPKKRRKRTIP